MEATVAESASYLLDRLASIPENARLLVGISGVPASGKTTFALLVTAEINRLYNARSPGGGTIALCVPQDGFHHSRAVLDTFPDVKQAYDRRGAAFTFDAHAFNDLVHKLRAPLPPPDSDPESATLRAPSFDHALKDPAPDSISIPPTARIVLIEGLYTFLGVDPWIVGAQLLDERWFVDADPNEATTRLVLRHVATGVGKDMDEAVWRAANNDTPNGQYIIQHMLPPTRTIKSVEDPNLAAKPHPEKELETSDAI